jgi:hypothetical protein
MRIALWILYLVGMGMGGYALGRWQARRRWLKNEREGVLSEPEGGYPCAGKAPPSVPFYDEHGRLHVYDGMYLIKEKEEK